MSTLRKVANALSFAHLAGFAGKARSEGDEPDDEDKKKDQASAEDPKDDDDKKDAKGAKADDDEKKKKDDESDDDYAKRMKAMDEDDDDKKDKKDEAKADDDSDEEMRGTGTSAAARRRERARCAAIFGSAAAGKNPVLAANLAFNTSMTRKEALVVLESTPAAAAPTHLGRQARNPNIGAGGSGTQTTQQATVSRWDAAFAKVAPQKRH